MIDTIYFSYTVNKKECLKTVKSFNPMVPYTKFHNP